MHGSSLPDYLILWVGRGVRVTEGWGLEWAVESTTVTHSSADWWDLGIAIDTRSDEIEGTNGFYCLIRKTLAKRGKRN